LKHKNYGNYNIYLVRGSYANQCQDDGNTNKTGKNLEVIRWICSAESSEAWSVYWNLMPIAN